MLLWNLIGIFLACLVLFLWTLTKPFYWRNKGIPYLFPFPFLGSNVLLLTTSLTDYFHKLYNKYPKDGILGFHFFSIPALFIKDPEIIKTILIKDFESFPSNGFYTNRRHDILGESILLTHGDEWRDMRTRVSAHFTPYKLRNLLFDYVENTMLKSRKYINELISKNRTIQAEKLTVKIATDVIVQSLLDIETDCFNNESYFSDLGPKLFSTRANNKFLISMIYPRLNDYLKINLVEKDSYEFLKRIFEDVLEYRKKNPSKKQDFLEAMIKSMHNMEENLMDADCVKNSSENYLKKVFAQTLLLIGAGIESAAMTMAYFLYEVSLNQEIQEKCRVEIMSLVAETGTDIRPQDFQKLKYFSLVLKETIRKHPPFLTITRRCHKLYKLPRINLTIEPGTLLFVPIKTIQWDPNNYPNPEQFIPERFEQGTKIDDVPYLSWGLGPRTCIGESFAKMEMFAVLTRLLRYYRFTSSSKTEVPLKLCDSTAAITPLNGVWLDVHQINDL